MVKPGYIKFEWEGGKFTPLPTKGIMGEEIGVAHVSGRRVELSRAEGEYIREHYIEPHNASLGKMSKITETSRDIKQRNIREAQDIRERIISMEITSKHMNFLSKIPEITDSMREYLKDPGNAVNQMMREKINEFITELDKLTPAELSKFYYDNEELFKDFTDYYGWLKEHSGRWDKGTLPGKRGKRKTAKGYVNQMSRSIDKLIARVKKYHK